MPKTLLMKDYYAERYRRVLDLAGSSADWRYLNEGFEMGRIPSQGDANRLTTSFDEHALLYWMSGTWKSIEPKYHPDRHLKYMVRMQQAFHDELLTYYRDRLLDIYPDLNFHKYEPEISTCISWGLHDFFIVNALTDTRRVLEYGAGYGRNLPIFRHNPNIKYIAADAIPVSMACFDVFNHGSFVQGLEPGIDLISELENQVPLYLKTSNLDDLPSASICTMMLIWCVSEMDETSVRDCLANIERLIRPEGAVLVRDNPTPFSHTIDLDQEIRSLGFRKTYEYEGERTYGLLRVYHRIGN